MSNYLAPGATLTLALLDVVQEGQHDRVKCAQSWVPALADPDTGVDDVAGGVLTVQRAEHAQRKTKTLENEGHETIRDTSVDVADKGHTGPTIAAVLIRCRDLLENDPDLMDRDVLGPDRGIVSAHGSRACLYYGLDR